MVQALLALCRYSRASFILCPCPGHGWEIKYWFVYVSIPAHHEVDIWFIPANKPGFTSQFAEAVKLCKNLKSFTCMTSAFCFLPYLENKTGLSELRVRADLADEQATRLTNFSAIQSLSLFWGSWNVMNMLPRWSRSIQQTLTSLVFHVSALLLAISVFLMCETKDVS